MTNIFTKHPYEVGETYLQHMWAASRYSADFFTVGFCIIDACYTTVFIYKDGELCCTRDE